MLENGWLEVMSFDGVKWLCFIKGKFRKTVWINILDGILVGLLDYGDNKVEVILKYNVDEGISFKVYGKFLKYVKINEIYIWYWRWGWNLVWWYWR